MHQATFWSDRLERAARLAAVGHRQQERRGSGVPYITHPFAVAWILEQADFDDETVIAGLLHDLVEDTATSLDQIRCDFGDLVADAVAGCSEIKVDPLGRPRSWEDRKRDHLVALGSASGTVRAVVLADKLHNLRTIRLDLEDGRPVWAGFHASRERVLWYFAAVIETCSTGDSRLAPLSLACRAELNRIRASPSEILESTPPMT